MFVFVPFASVPIRGSDSRRLSFETMTERKSIWARGSPGLKKQDRGVKQPLHFLHKSKIHPPNKIPLFCRKTSLCCVTSALGENCWMDVMMWTIKMVANVRTSRHFFIYSSQAYFISSQAKKEQNRRVLWFHFIILLIASSACISDFCASPNCALWDVSVVCHFSSTVWPKSLNTPCYDLRWPRGVSIGFGPLALMAAPLICEFDYAVRAQGPLRAETS